MADSDEIRARLRAKFVSTTRERVANLNAAFGALEGGRGDPATADTMMREIHTVKGESRIMAYAEANEIAHVTEDLLEWARARSFRLSAEASDLIYFGFDLILAHIDDDADSEAREAKRARFLEAARALLASGTEPPPAGPPGEANAPERQLAVKPTPTSPLSARDTTGNFSTTRPEGEMEEVGHGLGDFIRVPAATVAALTSLTGELLIRQEAIGREIALLWERLRRGDAADHEPLLHEAGDAAALRRLRDEAFEARLRLAELQDTVRRLRLLEVSVLFERYPAAIRELARERGKRIRVVLKGREVAVDKQVLDLVDEAVLHMVRNSVDHGIESAEERKAAGKPEQGTITLAARQLGTQVEIVVRDDGRGMDPDRIRKAAAERGILTEAEAQKLDDDAALELVFRPGFSTREEVSDLSGRGVGLDVVNDQVRGLGGTTELVTRLGEGTSFTLMLPISVALSRILCFRCGPMLFGLPSANVGQVMRIAESDAEPAGDGLAVRLEGRRIPLVDLRRSFGVSGGASSGVAQLVVVEHGSHRVGLAIDDFIGERQVVQRSLGRFLGGLRLLSGTVILEKRQVALLLSVPELLRRFGEGDTRIARALPQTDQGPAWRVAIVDDSELTRDMLVGLARRARLEVLEAVNGRDALTQMRDQPPDLVLTDLDMPVMNGFELIAALRRDPDLQEIPVIVLSTRGSDADKQRAMAAGANDYIVKSNFSEQSLSEALDRFLDVRFR